MAFNEIKYTQTVWHYQEPKRKFWQEGENRVLSLYLRPPDARCLKCKSSNVATYKHRDRTLIGLPYGKCQVRFVVPVCKVICRDCKAVTYERVAFAACKNTRITRLLAKKFLAHAAGVSMKSLAEGYRVSWRTVRDAIEIGLRKRYRRRDYSNVRNIGVDELYVFRHERPSRRFITTVRDQDTGSVIDVTRGKGAVALKRLERKIAPLNENIKTISMDMASSTRLSINFAKGQYALFVGLAPGHPPHPLLITAGSVSPTSPSKSQPSNPHSSYKTIWICANM